MIDFLFRHAAAEAGWSDATQIGILLRFAARASSASSFRAFLDHECSTDDTADPFMEAVIVALRNPGLALDVSFRRYCAGCRDLLTPRQAAERWCCWRGN